MAGLDNKKIARAFGASDFCANLRRDDVLYGLSRTRVRHNVAQPFRDAVASRLARWRPGKCLSTGVEYRCLQAKDQKGHRGSSEGQFGDRNLNTGHGICEGFKFGDLAWDLGEVAGHRDIPHLTKTNLNYRSNCTGRYGAMILGVFGKRREIVYKNMCLDAKTDQNFHVSKALSWLTRRCVTCHRGQLPC